MTPMHATLREENETLATAAGHARLSVATRVRWVVTLADEAGVVGEGEASPLPGYSPDSGDEARDALVRMMAAVEGEAAPRTVEAVAQWMARWTAEAPSAQFAMETALFGRVPARAVEGLPRAVNAMLGSVLDGDVEARAAEKVERGFHTLKLKVGVEGRWSDELARVRAVRARWPAVALRLDANGAWSVEEARAALGALAEVGVEFVEEPTLGEGLFALAGAGASWAADESLRDQALAERVLREGAAAGCAAVVLKPTVLGGALACEAIAEEAEKAGLGVVVTHCFEGAVGRRAVEALAGRAGSVWLAQGVDR